MSNHNYDPVVGIRKAFRFAVCCWAVPLVAGLSTFLLWIVTNWDALEMVGLYVILAGTAMFVAGYIVLMLRLVETARTANIPHRRIWLSTAIVSILMFSNFPVAWRILHAVEGMEDRYKVTVKNETTQQLEQVRLFGVGNDEDLGTIQTDDSAKRFVNPHTFGALQFSAQSGATKYSTTVTNNPQPGQQDGVTITVQANGTVSTTGCMR